MHINPLGPAETRSVSIAASPAIVLDLVGDARRLPEWAPAFASTVTQDGEDWLIDSAGTQLRLRVVVSRDAGTVDLLRKGDPRHGARMRVVENEAGSELVFTLIFPRGVGEDVVARQMSTVESELRTVRNLCESQTRAVA